MHELFDLTADDGTRLTAWRNAVQDGPRVLICNGMGVPPEAWPRLIDDECRFQVAGWNQRGVLGSAVPDDPTRIEIADHVDDAVALLDDLGWDDAIVLAWSLGVNVAFELARAHPHRVSGILSIAGVPGGTFDSVLATIPIPRSLRRPLGKGLVQAGRLIAPQLTVLTRMLHKQEAFAELIRFSGVVLPTAHISDVRPWAQAMFTQEWTPYFELAMALERHGRIDPSFIQVPVTILAGEFDALTSHDDVLAFARQIPHAETHSLPGSHCLPLEYPDGVVSLLEDLLARIEGTKAGRTYLDRFQADLERVQEPEDAPAVTIPQQAGVHSRRTVVGPAPTQTRAARPDSGSQADAAAVPAARQGGSGERAWFGGRTRAHKVRPTERGELPWWATTPEDEAQWAPRGSNPQPTD